MSKEEIQVGDLVALGFQLFGIVIALRWGHQYVKVRVYWFDEGFRTRNPTWVHARAVTKLKTRKENE